MEVESTHSDSFYSNLHSILHCSREENSTDSKNFDDKFSLRSTKDSELSCVNSYSYNLHPPKQIHLNNNVNPSLSAQNDAETNFIESKKLLHSREEFFKSLQNVRTKAINPSNEPHISSSNEANFAVINDKFCSMLPFNVGFIENFPVEVSKLLNEIVSSVVNEDSKDNFVLKSLKTFQTNFVSGKCSEKSVNDKKVESKNQVCEICKKNFLKKSELARHIRIHTGEKPFSCEVCHESFSQQINLISHLTVHTGEKPFACEICGKMFSRKSLLLQHCMVHTGKRDYSCTLCDKKFYNNSDLIKHTRTHTGSKPFNCDVCGKTFAQKINMIKHQTVHTGEKPYKCDLCLKTFSRKAHLSTHLLIHTGEKPFTCDVCSKNFTRKEHLVWHISSHTNEKPYSCADCGMTFALKNAFKRHAVVHTGAKPFPCKLCDKQFMDKGSLTVHELTHSGVKKFACEICQKKFYRNADVMRHVRIHSPTYRQTKRKYTFSNAQKNKGPNNSENYTDSNLPQFEAEKI